MNHLSRREFLTAALGTSVALAACQRKPSALPFGGELLGQNAKRGHKLRDGFRPPPVRREKVAVAIVGAGMAGLSAAWKLERKGLRDFTVLELEDHFGGTSASGQSAVSGYPWGAHYVPVPLPGEADLTDLLTEVGAITGFDASGHPIVAEDQLCRAPHERLFMAGEWFEGLYPRYAATREDLRQLRAFEAEMSRWVGVRDAQGRRGFAIPTATCGRSPELQGLDRMSMAELLAARGWDSERLRWYVEYACRDDYGCQLETTSAWAGVFYYTARVEKPGGPGAPFVTWPRGNGHLAQHLASVAGKRLRTGVAVTDVIPRDDGVELHAWDAAKGEAFAIDAEHAVFAAPQFLAARLVKPYRERPPAHLAQLSYSSWLTANLTLRRRPQEWSFPLAWDNVFYESKSLGYVVDTHQTGKDYGSSVWTYYLPLPDPDPKRARQLLLTADWKHWAQAIVDDLRRAHPDIDACIERMDIWRWGHAMVRPTPGLFTSGALPAARAPLGRLRFANTDLSGMALFEEAQHWGVQAAEAILAERAR